MILDIMKGRHFYKNVPNATNFLFDLGMESGMEKPRYIKVGSEFYLMDRMNINYGTNNYNEAFKEIVNFNKDYNGLPHNIKPYTNHRTLEISYRIYVFDTRYQNDHKGPQPIQLNFKISAAVADVIYPALVLTGKIISDNSDGNKMVDIIS